ncbi:type II toxin-antitoxin system PemK/MazF family toxin [Mesorhizobium sp. LHD-90]|uniref:type II toxin-antitoxin system PemK/MazF family toxin n=1 Tax=Mesorhizobium sp. LHD-90 TaxID=3071414 RepID=UPI0027E1BDED|nr:type II toxin-antitoxin system PemK/MazF family toxin [Mesorhizobium sp. LHD-90]MDQ6436741.1 type II toxin-antitoxin system PemK/MazF family toxin [Mesorhizobium sp. LHD-90]
MIFDRYQVVVVPYPFHERPITKRRPALVLSGRRFNEENDQTWVAMITTAKETSWPSDIVIKDLETAGLKHPCVLRFRFQTLPNPIFVRAIGHLAGLDRLACERQLANMLL